MQTKRLNTKITINRNNTDIEVDATLLGDEEGVFGVCRNPNRYEEVWLLHGDDGFWWVMGVYHQDWLPGIIATLKNA